MLNGKKFDTVFIVGWLIDYLKQAIIEIRAKGIYKHVFKNATINFWYGADIIMSDAAATKKYSLKEVEAHKDKKSCWIVISDNVYDVTKFLEEVITS